MGQYVAPYLVAKGVPGRDCPVAGADRPELGTVEEVKPRLKNKVRSNKLVRYRQNSLSAAPRGRFAKGLKASPRAETVDDDAFRYATHVTNSNVLRIVILYQRHLGAGKVPPCEAEQRPPGRMIFLSDPSTLSPSRRAEQGTGTLPLIPRESFPMSPLDSREKTLSSTENEFRGRKKAPNAPKVDRQVFFR